MLCVLTDDPGSWPVRVCNSSHKIAGRPSHSVNKPYNLGGKPKWRPLNFWIPWHDANVCAYYDKPIFLRAFFFFVTVLQVCRNVYNL